MPCIESGNVVVCGPERRAIKRRIMNCPVCDRRTRHVVQWDGAWYGTTIYCVSCGDRWQDGELSPRPFQRGWRERAKVKARGMWDNATTSAAWDRYIRADRAVYMPGVDEDAALSELEEARAAL